MWIRYDGTPATQNVHTSEDFLEGSFFCSRLKETLELFKIPHDVPEIPDARRLEHVKNWLLGSGIDKSLVSAIMGQLKTTLFDDLAPRNILPIYYEFLAFLAASIFDRVESDKG